MRPLQNSIHGPVLGEWLNLKELIGEGAFADCRLSEQMYGTIQYKNAVAKLIPKYYFVYDWI